MQLALDDKYFMHRLMKHYINRDEDYEPEICRFLKQVLCPGDNFVDVGAHIGYFTILGAELVENGKVYAFEAEKENFKQLKSHIKRNGYKNVKAFNKIVGDTNREAEIYVCLDNDGGHSLWNPGNHPFNSETRKSAGVRQSVGMVTLDSLVDIVPKAIKIDVEGCELLVLKGAENLIRKHKPAVILEINAFALEQMGTTQHEIGDFMKSLGYAAFNMETGAILPNMVDEDELRKLNINVVFINLPKHLMKAK
jgi:FkbM family methyltransferase